MSTQNIAFGAKGLLFVRTVAGDIAPEELGVTNAHEHVFIRNGLILVQEPDFRLDSEDAAISELSNYAQFGGRAVVDTAPLAIGRDPDALLRVSQASDVHIIAATGFHKSKYYLDTHWRFHLSVDEIATLLVSEIQEGMDVYGFESPRRQRSKARAGVIKVASDYQQISASSRTAIEAAAIAHGRTGAPVLTHTELGTMAMEQLDLLEKGGVSPRHVVLSHVDRNPDLSLHRELAQRGAYLEYDGPGRIKYFPESTLLNLIRGIFEAGLESQILIGGDTARRSYWKAYGGGPGIAYTQEYFVPRMLREGFDERSVQRIFVMNPSVAFQFRS